LQDAMLLLLTLRLLLLLPGCHQSKEPSVQ
jgi:hypothetical protein